MGHVRSAQLPPVQPSQQSHLPIPSSRRGPSSRAGSRSRGRWPRPWPGGGLPAASSSASHHRRLAFMIGAASPASKLGRRFALPSMQRLSRCAGKSRSSAPVGPELALGAFACRDASGVRASVSRHARSPRPKSRRLSRASTGPLRKLQCSQGLQVFIGSKARQCSLPEALVALRLFLQQCSPTAESAARGAPERARRHSAGAHHAKKMSMRLAMKASLESAQLDEKAKQKELRKAKKEAKRARKAELAAAAEAAAPAAAPAPAPAAPPRPPAGRPRAAGRGAAPRRRHRRPRPWTRRPRRRRRRNPPRRRRRRRPARAGQRRSRRPSPKHRPRRARARTRSTGRSAHPAFKNSDAPRRPPQGGRPRRDEHEVPAQEGRVRSQHRNCGRGQGLVQGARDQARPGASRARRGGRGPTTSTHIGGHVCCCGRVSSEPFSTRQAPVEVHQGEQPPEPVQQKRDSL